MKNFRNLFYKIGLGAGILSLALGMNYLYAAWTAPTAPPPGGNVSAPVNIGTTAQVKNGSLSVNAFSAFGSAYVQGNLGIGVVSPSYKVDIGGTPGTDGIRFPDGTVQTSAGGGGTLTMSFSKYMQVQHRVTVDYTLTAGWITHTINYDVENSISGASRSGNQIILPAGTYYADGDASAFSTSRVKNVLYNVTDGIYTLIGPTGKPNGGSSDNGGDSSQIAGKFIITGTKTFEFRTYSQEGGSCVTTNDTAAADVCLDLRIWKLD